MPNAINNRMRIRNKNFPCTGQWRPARNQKIAIEENIPVDFTYKIIDKLTRARLLDSQVGRTGGVRILRPLDEISLYDIINIIDQNRHVFRCVHGDNNCKLNTGTRPCMIHQELKRIQNIVEDELKRKTLKEVLGE